MHNQLWGSRPSRGSSVVGNNDDRNSFRIFFKNSWNSLKLPLRSLPSLLQRPLPVTHSMYWLTSFLFCKTLSTSMFSRAWRCWADWADAEPPNKAATTTNKKKKAETVLVLVANFIFSAAESINGNWQWAHLYLLYTTVHGDWREPSKERDCWATNERVSPCAASFYILSFARSLALSLSLSRVSLVSRVSHAWSRSLSIYSCGCS